MKNKLYEKKNNLKTVYIFLLKNNISNGNESLI